MWVLRTEPGSLKEQLLTARTISQALHVNFVKGTGVVVIVCDKCVVRLGKASIAGT